MIWGGLDAEELNIEDQQSAGASAAGVFAVGEIGRNPEAAFFALDHQLHAFGPAWDDFIETKADAFACWRLVKDAAVGVHADIAHFDAGVAAWFRAFAFFDDHVLQATSGCFNASFVFVSCHERLAFGFVAFGDFLVFIVH